MTEIKYIDQLDLDKYIGEFIEIELRTSDNREFFYKGCVLGINSNQIEINDIKNGRMIFNLNSGFVKFKTMNQFQLNKAVRNPNNFGYRRFDLKKDINDLDKRLDIFRRR